MYQEKSGNPANDHDKYQPMTFCLMFVAIRVHMAFTDGHPRNEPTNSIYYAYIENNHLYRGQYSYTMPGV
jgi:hypothetical protein